MNRWYNWLKNWPGWLRVTLFIVTSLGLWLGFGRLIGVVGGLLPDALKLTTASVQWVRVLWTVVALGGGMWVSSLAWWPAPPDPEFPEDSQLQKWVALATELQGLIPRIGEWAPIVDERLDRIEESLHEPRLSAEEPVFIPRTGKPRRKAEGAKPDGNGHEDPKEPAPTDGSSSGPDAAHQAAVQIGTPKPDLEKGEGEPSTKP